MPIVQTRPSCPFEDCARHRSPAQINTRVFITTGASCAAKVKYTKNHVNTSCTHVAQVMHAK